MTRYGCGIKRLWSLASSTGAPDRYRKRSDSPHLVRRTLTCPLCPDTQDLKLLIENSGADAVEMDFKGVKFATRSFIDEFYNLFLKKTEVNTFRVELTNVPADIKAMLESVSRTQVRANVIPSESQEVSFKNVKEFLNYFSTLVL